MSTLEKELTIQLGSRDAARVLRGDIGRRLDAATDAKTATSDAIPVAHAALKQIRVDMAAGLVGADHRAASEQLELAKQADEDAEGVLQGLEGHAENVDIEIDRLEKLAASIGTNICVERCEALKKSAAFHATELGKIRVAWHEYAALAQTCATRAKGAFADPITGSSGEQSELTAVIDAGMRGPERRGLTLADLVEAPTKTKAA